MNPSRLQELLDALRVRIEACLEYEDASGVLEDSALNQASELWLAWTLEPGPRVDVINVLARLHWCRYLALPEGQDREDGGTALELFRMVSETEPGLVPPEVARILGTPAQGAAAVGDDPGALYNQGVLLLNEFEETSQQPTIDQALALFREAASRIPPGHPRRGLIFAGLTGACIIRFDAFGDIQDLDQAVNQGDEAVRATPASNGDRPDALSKSGMAYLTRYQRFGEITDLETAIRLSTEAAQHAAGHPRGADFLSNAALAFREQFERSGAKSDLDRFVTYAEAARAATRDDDPGFARSLANLGAAYQIRFTRLGDPADLSQAIRHWQHAERVSASRLDHPVMLSGLGLAFRMQFELTGADADLDKAIQLSAQAVEETSATHAAYPGLLSNCAAAYRLRFERFQDDADLDQAVRYALRATEAAPDGHPERAKYLGGLASLRYALFLEDGGAGYLDEAIRLGHLALQAGSGSSDVRQTVLSDLGLAYRVRYEQNKAHADLERAVLHGGDAVDATPVGHPGRALRMCNLSLSYRARYELSGVEQDLERALHWGTAAVDATPGDHPARAMFLASLALAYSTRSERGASRALGQAIACWREAVRSPVASAHDRLTAAIAWGTGCEALADPALAAEGFTEAVRLLPLLAWRGQGRRLREKHLANAGGLVTDAAAWAIETGNLENAVELLELGRSVLWSQSLQLRTDLSLLCQTDPVLAARLEEVRAALDQPPGASGAFEGAPGKGDWNPQLVETRQRELARQWDGLVRQVRNIGKMKTFLAATPFSRLREAASGGPVVVVNIGNRRCDALVITTSGVRLCPLPGLTADECSRRADILLNAFNPVAAVAHSGSPNGQLVDVLFDIMNWLWDKVCEPVLDDLREHGDLPTAPPAPETTPPRLWWCPTGPLTLLPLHAAGRYQDAEGSYLSRFATCSYTSTLEALVSSRERPQTGTGTQLLVVGMPTTPDFGSFQFSDLPGVLRELASLAKVLPSVKMQVLSSPTRSELVAGSPAHEGTQPTVDRVLRELPSHSWVHFSCHGGQNLLDPSQSAFYLSDGPLTVLRISAHKLPAAELAFLSACQTAVGGVRVPDEAIHLAASLQFAGYRHVIATAWSISDILAPQVARETYAYLGDTGTLTGSRAAVAIHRAVKSLLAREPRRPDLWAPYLHIGP